MLSVEQERAFEKGFAAYQKTCAHWEDPLCDARLKLFTEALEALGEFVDEVDDIYYRVIFANLIEDMQETGIFDLSPACNRTKIGIYIETLQWFVNADSYTVGYKPYLWSVFNKLSVILLKGEELPRNDDLARLCCSCNKALEHPMADALLSLYEKGDDGKWIYVGVRPE